MNFAILIKSLMQYIPQETFFFQPPKMKIT